MAKRTGVLSRQLLEPGVVEGYNPGAPTAAYTEPGKCVFGDTWAAAPLLSKVSISHDTRVFTFGLADKSTPLGLSTCACMLVKGVDGPNDEKGEPIARPYTPVSTNAMLGQFQLMVKIYPEGKISQHLDKLAVGGSMMFRHVGGNVKIQYPVMSKVPHIGMIVGGCGITPMIQALHCTLGTAGDTSKVSMLYGSKTSQEILAKETLDSWASSHKDRFNVTHVLDQEPAGSSWTGARGFITREMIEKNFPKPSDNCLIFVCGPPPMYEIFSGPRDPPGAPVSELKGLLKEMGYKTEQVIKF